MSRYTIRLFYLLPLLFIITQCREKEWDDYYDRPDWLAAPIYQQLQQRGNFKHFLACVDKTEYKRTLSGAGYFTAFVPNDEAFEKFFQAHGHSGVNDLEPATIQQIVSYALVYNAFKKDRLSDFQSTNGWVAGKAFKRRTAYYTGVYSGMIGNQSAKIISTNRNGFYILNDNNNKYVPYFLTPYFTTQQLTAYDYNFFYPQTPFTGFNVANAAVVNADIEAENGVIHEINEVLLPLPSLEQYLWEKPEYSDFKKILETYAARYEMNEASTHRYQVLTGSSDQVYVKSYVPALAFSPNNENFLKASDNDGQSDGWSMFVPTNEALNNYINTVLLEHYPSLDKMPVQIIYDFLNAHMWQTTVWPSKFKSTTNFLGEDARFNPASDVKEAKVLSNGMFYGTTKVQEANVFSSVYGKPYLDPKYSMMIRALEGDLKFTISNPSVRYTLFMMSDEALTKAGFSYNIQRSEWQYNGSGFQARERLNRILNSHIVVTFQNELDDLSGEGIIETFGGEYIKYKNNTVLTAGTLDNNQEVKVTDVKTANNGIVYYLDGILTYTEKAVGLHIQPDPNFSKFFAYLNNSSLYNKATGTIGGILPGTAYTLFIPTNEAIDAAVAEGWLPANTNPTAFEDRDKVIKFIQYHIMAKKTVVPNGKEEGSFETLYKTSDGETTTLRIANQPNAMQVTDMLGNTANVIVDKSNVLSNRTVIHQIDTFLKYAQGN